MLPGTRPCRRCSTPSRASSRTAGMQGCRQVGTHDSHSQNRAWQASRWADKAGLAAQPAANAPAVHTWTGAPSSARPALPSPRRAPPGTDALRQAPCCLPPQVRPHNPPAMSCGVSSSSWRSGWRAANSRRNCSAYRRLTGSMNTCTGVRRIQGRARKGVAWACGLKREWPRQRKRPAARPAAEDASRGGKWRLGGGGAFTCASRQTRPWRGTAAAPPCPVPG